MSEGAWYFAMFAVVAVLAVVANFACATVPSSDRAERAVEALGLKDAHVVSRGPAWGVLGGCHEKDITRFVVRATAADGSTRTVEVCAPVVGGYTVRG